MSIIVFDDDIDCLFGDDDVKMFKAVFNDDNIKMLIIVLDDDNVIYSLLSLMMIMFKCL
jgi:hypothetical protein